MKTTTKYMAAGALGALYGVLAPALAIDSGEINDAIEKVSTIALNVLKFIFGGGANTQEFIFSYLLPALLVFFIVYDMVYLLGFFRKTTARVIAMIFALFAGRFGTYAKVVEMIGKLMGVNGIFVPSITLVFTLIIIWWVVGHILLGFKITKSMYQSRNGLEMLMEIGDALERGPKHGG